MGVCMSSARQKAVVEPLNARAKSKTDYSTDTPHALDGVISKLYISYPDELDPSTVASIQTKHPDTPFTKYYATKAELQKRHEQGRDVLNLHIYDHPNITTQAPKILKEKLIRCIEKNDKEEVQKTLEEGIKPNESVGKPGYGETLFHHLAKKNNYLILLCVVEWVKSSKTPEELDTYMSIPDAEGNTPLMVAVLCDASECLFAMVESGVKVDYELKNKAGLTLLEIAKYFSEKSKEILSRAKTIAEIADVDSIKKTEDPKRVQQPKEKTVTILIQGLSKKIETAQKSSEDTTKKKIDSKEAPIIRTDVSFTLEQFTPEYQLLISKLAEAGQEYVDPDFPREPNSLGYKQTPEHCWKRDYQIVEKEKGTVKVLGKVNPYDILVGSMWSKTSSIIQALTILPSIITTIFNTKESNPQGVYSITLFQNGLPKEVIIDNFFPVDLETNKPLFFRTVGKKTWVLALSKALAKFNTTFRSLDELYPAEILEDITPIPFWIVMLPKDWDEIMLANELDKLISLDAITFFYTSGNCIPDKDRLRPFFFYQMLEKKRISSTDIVVAKNLGGRDTKLFESLADLGLGVSDSDGFTPNALEEGIFPVSCSGFKEKVNAIYIFPQIPDAKYTYLPIQTDGNHADYFEFEISKEIKGLFKFYGFRPGQFTIIKDLDTKPSIIMSQEENYLLNLLSFSKTGVKVFAPGKYVIRVKNTMSTVLGFYGSDYITMTRVQREKHKNYLLEYLKLKYKKDPTEGTVDIEVSQVKIGVEEYSVVFYKNNTTVTKKISLKIVRESPDNKLPKIFDEKDDRVILIAKPGELQAIYSKAGKMPKLNAVHTITDATNGDQSDIKLNLQQSVKENSKVTVQQKPNPSENGNIQSNVKENNKSSEQQKSDPSAQQNTQRNILEENKSNEVQQQKSDPSAKQNTQRDIQEENKSNQMQQENPDPSAKQKLDPSTDQNTQVNTDQNTQANNTQQNDQANEQQKSESTTEQNEEKEAKTNTEQQKDSEQVADKR